MTKIKKILDELKKDIFEFYKHRDSGIKDLFLKFYFKKSNSKTKLFLSFLFTNIAHMLSFKPAFKYVGENWNETHSDKPVALMWGFNLWKREFTSEALTEYRTAYVFAKVMWVFVKRHLHILPKENKYVFISWSYKIPKAALRYAKKHNIDVFYVEDGFLRSLNLEVKQTKALSLCIDKKGMYFDANKESQLEELIKTYNFDADADIKERALNAIEIAKSLRLSKYYDLNTSNDNNYLDAKDIIAFQEEITSKAGIFYKQNISNTYIILVIGQVSNDASITYGCHRKISNVEIIQQAHKDYPDALIYYRPHPDVFFGNRSEKSDFTKVESFCRIVDFDIPLHNLFKSVDHVYTITSLAGFEALLYDKKVTVLGNPFYAGWGLTEDKNPISRRNIKREFWQVFAISYLIYPRYVHPISNKKIDFFELASYFFIKKALNFDIFKLSNVSFELDILLKHSNQLSTPAQLLMYLHKTGDFASANLNNVETIIMNDNFSLEDFGDCASLLGRTSNFNILKEYCNFLIKKINYIKEYNYYQVYLLTSFYNDLFFTLKYLKGRTIENLSPLPKDFFIEFSDDLKLKIKFLSSYIQVLSANLQYDLLEDVFNNLDNLSLTYQYWEQICNTLNQTTFRKERNYALRNRIILKIASLYKKKLNENFNNHHDIFLNSALYYIVINEKKSVMREYQNYMSFINLNLTILESRINDVIKIFQYLLVNGESDFTAEMLLFLKNNNLISKKYKHLFFLEWFHKGKNQEIIQNYSKFKGDFKKIQSYFIKALKNNGHFQDALFLLEQQKNTPLLSIKKYRTIKEEINQIKFSIKASSILNSYPQPCMPKGVIFIASHTCYNTMARIIPVLVESQKMGYAVVNLTAGILNQPDTGLDFIDKFSGIVSQQLENHKIENEWYVNWSKKQVINNNINYYQGFYEDLSVKNRQYYIDLNQKNIYINFLSNLRRADKWLSVCNAIYKEVVLEKQFPTILIGGNTHVTPFSIARDFCINKDHKLLSYINTNVAYENYFSNLGGKFSTTMCVTDMTLHKTRRAPFLASKDKFDIWYEENKNNKEIIEKIQPLLTVNRNNAQTNDTELELIDYLNSQKAQGKKIVCAFGKIPVDLGVPYDGGNAHEDMDDWLNHTIEVCKKDPNIILLIKPHPHELKPEIAMDLITKLSDMIKHDLSDNIKLLGHRDINVHSLAPLLDLAILYNGSSALELVTQGVPVMMTAYFGKYDYPVDLIYPENREHYEAYILAKEYPKPADEIRKKSAFLIAYMGTDDIAIPNTYAKCTITNDSIGTPEWDHKKIDHFLKYGDPYMTIAAYRIIEKFEPDNEINFKKKFNMGNTKSLVE